MENNPSNIFSKPTVSPKTRRSEGCEKPDSHSAELRPVYAAYLNMAQMNLFNTLKAIEGKLGIVTPDAKEDYMEGMKIVGFDKDKNIKEVEVRVKAFKELLKRIPVLQSLSGYQIKDDVKTVSFEDVAELLLAIVKIVHYYRNEYSHTHHYYTDAEKAEEADFEKRIMQPLDLAFKSAKRNMAKVHGYGKKELDFIDGNERQEVTGKGRDKKVKYYTDYYFRLGNDDFTRLSDVGIAFIVCKLLNKKYAIQFLQQSKIMTPRSQGGLSPFSQEENEVMANIFCAERIRLPKGRMEVESLDRKAALGLDMLNELQKCPKELFDTFCQDDKELFKVVQDEEEQQSDLEDGALMRRNDDRFPVLALRYIDEQKVLNGMAFQVSLGNYRYQFYNKTTIDPSDPNRVRILQKEINGFGPMHLVESKFKEKYGKDGFNLIRESQSEAPADTASTKPYLTDKRASYVIHNNRVCIMLKEKGSPLDKDCCYLPDLPVPKEENGTQKVNRSGDEKEKDWPHTCWLSIYDLPALVFLHLLGGNPGQVIRDYVGKIRSLLNDIAEEKCVPPCCDELSPTDGSQRKKTITKPKEVVDIWLKEQYNLPLSSVPEKIVDYLAGVSGGSMEEERHKAEDGFSKWAKSAVEKEIGDTELRQKRFQNDKKRVGSKANRIGKKSYVEIRPGRLADFLAKDIMKMQPADAEKNHCGKLTGQNYQIMQAAIATFKGDGRECRLTGLGELFVKAGLVGKDNQQKHPFLDKVLTNEITDTLDFYEKYLEEKKYYLEQLLCSEKYSEAYFLHGGLNDYKPKDRDYIKLLAGRYKDTFQLPDGLFADAISECLKKEDNVEIRNAAEGENRNNAAYLLRVYFTNKYDDDSQPFYFQTDGRFKRHYKVFDTIEGKKDATYRTVEEIRAMLRKGAADKAPVRRAIAEHLNTMQMPGKPQWINGKKKPSWREATPDEKKAEAKKCQMQLRYCQQNERAIRRYKAEDMLMFMMAKRLLLESDNVLKKGNLTGLEAFKLRDIKPIGCKNGPQDNILNQQIDFSAAIDLFVEEVVHYTDKKGEEGTRFKTVNKDKKVIRQSGLKIKNIGDFYRFIFDSRLGSLLSQIEGDTFEREMVEKELDTYDNRRKDGFKTAHEIERVIIGKNKEQIETRFKNEKAAGLESKKIVYNKFGELLKYCELTSDIQAKIVDIRNMLAHNKYMDNIERIVDKDDMTLPQVLEEIIEWLQDNSKKITHTDESTNT